MGTLVSYKYPVLKSGIHVRTSPFGMRTLNGVTKMHNGVDLVSNTKADGTGDNTTDYIIAFAGGYVLGVLNTCAGKTPSTGNYVKIMHDGGETTVYYHMAKGTVKVKAGDTVRAGDVLGYMGSTGNSTGAHLHFGIMVDGEYVDPEPYLRGEKELRHPEATELTLAVLCRGMKSGEVGSLQRLLRSYGIRDDSGDYIAIDNSFGAKTEQAVKRYQQSKALTVTGKADHDTWASLLGVIS